MSKWKKVRVIVELPVGENVRFTQGDLAWNVKSAIARDDRFAEQFDVVGRFGRVRVKRYSHVQGYETRVLRRKVTER